MTLHGPRRLDSGEALEQVDEGSVVRRRHSAAGIQDTLAPAPRTASSKNSLLGSLQEVEVRLTGHVLDLGTGSRGRHSAVGMQGMRAPAICAASSKNSLLGSLQEVEVRSIVQALRMSCLCMHWGKLHGVHRQ